MECTWDNALLAKLDQLPVDLVEVIRRGSNEAYLDTLTRITLDPRYTYIVFTHAEPIFAHLCASLLPQADFARTLAVLGRIVPFAPYLCSYAIRLLQNCRSTFKDISDREDLIQYLLATFRLLRHDHHSFELLFQASGFEELLKHRDRAVRYLAIRILQILLKGADAWFEGMVTQYLGRDEKAIQGQWDGRNIDYRFLSLWEEQRRREVSTMREEATQLKLDNCDGQIRRILGQDLFDSSVALVGGMLFPRSGFALSNTTSNPNRDMVETPTTASNISRLARALTTSQPVLLSGSVGSGKSMMVRHAAAQLGKAPSMVTLHLNEQSDAKLLVGIYATGSRPGSFEWRPGVLTRAVMEGRWLFIEDLDRTPNEILSTLLPLIEKRELSIPSRKHKIHAHPEFRIIATVRTTLNHRGEETRPLVGMLGARHWLTVSVAMPALDEQQLIINTLFPKLQKLLPQLMATYTRLISTRLGFRGQGNTVGVMRPLSLRDLLKWCKRVANLLDTPRGEFTSEMMDDIFLEACDCFVGAMPPTHGPSSLREHLTAVIAEELHVNPQRRDHLLYDREAMYTISKTSVQCGRYRLPRAASALLTKRDKTEQGHFSTNPHTSRMLQRVSAAISNKEPLLLVGETGVGKTTSVQHLATQLGRKLVAFNLSQQSEAGDLLGGFKPVSARSLVVPMNDEFNELFTSSFSPTKNQQFLDLLAKALAKGNWKAVAKLWRKALSMVDAQRQASTPPSSRPTTPGPDGQVVKKRKVGHTSVDFPRWDSFRDRLEDLSKRLEAGDSGFAFAFVEGKIVEAVRRGDWILLDEINLASPDTLEALQDLFSANQPSLTMAEAGEVDKVIAADGFQVFAAMNPATDVGKKDLPAGIRSKFTEIYVESPDRDSKSLQSIVKSYLGQHAVANASAPNDITALYQTIIRLSSENKLVDGSGSQPHFSLRSLTRCLSFAVNTVRSGGCGLRRALYEGFLMSFTTFLDQESEALVLPLLEKHLLSTSKKSSAVKSELQKPLRHPGDGREYLVPFPGSKHWLRKGPIDTEERPGYIITPFIRRNLENLVRATSTGQFPVLVQGPTSSGKTSMVEFLAHRTGHKFVRINNHEFTDLQEYLGTYVSDTEGKLKFEEGVLVKALREGSWVVLDELNLAPTDVLEALNRLLDDNRELLVPETQQIVRPSAGFQLFATQNPAGLYGGRKMLSRAFRNRFLELHFDDIPVEELQTILHKRTQLPESRCKRVVQVYRELSVLRQEGRVFEQKDGFATLRDLFRWAGRGNDTIEDLAANGFMLLTERVRSANERAHLKEIMNRVMSANGPKVGLETEALYGSSSPEILAYQQRLGESGLGIVWTKAMMRLYCLVARAIASNEPVLLVGETGCGKTTVVQMLADALKQNLRVVNAHANTETGDLIGSQRPVRNRASIEDELRSNLTTSVVFQNPGSSLSFGTSTEEILESFDRAVASLSAQEKATYIGTSEYSVIKSLRTKRKALFEWADGSLVSAMREGCFFLLDEISLADDSVLERINSVLEPSRTILLAEKGVGSDDVAKSDSSAITAHPGFQFLATMNPGGDYGKRELSPALRNRFTEIWVPPLTDMEDVVTIVRAKLAPVAASYAEKMVSFAAWFKARFNTSAASTISIRDALAWTAFVNELAGQLGILPAIVHGAAMIFIDTLGANPAGLLNLTTQSLESERKACIDELGRLLQVDAYEICTHSIEVDTGPDHFVVGPFHLSRRPGLSETPSNFSFDASTTRRNAMRVARALQLPKPVMLEGSPGVGKTALVTAIASACNVPLSRINLSEQTDLMDLFGADIPVPSADNANGIGKFSWKDAPFLQAMKNGNWVLLDEMNLASQSVLEGLNSVIDHRGEAYIPEIGLTVKRHPNFRLFAAQNPHHQGGGRKGLPASFVNRFTVVYADVFSAEDMALIVRKAFPEASELAILRAVDFVSRLDFEVGSKRFGAAGGPWEFNLRDIIRWLQLETSDASLLKSAGPRDFVGFLFAQRFRSPGDREGIDRLFSQVFPDASPPADLVVSASVNWLQIGLGLLPRHPLTCPSISNLALQQATRYSLQTLQALMLAVQQAWPVVLAGPSASGKTAMIERLASGIGAELVTFSVNADTDAMDLVGGYEQADPHRKTSQARDALGNALTTLVKEAKLRGFVEGTSKLLRALTAPDLDTDVIIDFIRVHGDPQHHKELMYLAHEAQADEPQGNNANFQWMDGVLVDALQKGYWLVLDNANLCSSSVLDRLNGLLEPNGALVINENTESVDGTARVIHPHPSFRIFLTLDPKYGELSRPMRNRAVEIYLPGRDDRDALLTVDPLLPESRMTRIFQLSALPATEEQLEFSTELLHVVSDHVALIDEGFVESFHGQLSDGMLGDALNGMQAPVNSAVVHKQNSSQLLLEQYHEQSFGSADFAHSQVSTDSNLPVGAALADGEYFLQTLHPLNNQPLVQQTVQCLSSNLRLAVIHEAAIALSRIRQALQDLSDSAALRTKILRAERSFGLAKGGQSSLLFSMLDRMGSAIWHWTQQLPALAVDEFICVQNAVSALCTSWWTIWSMLSSSSGFDLPTLSAGIAAGQGILETLSRSGMSQLRSLAIEVGGHMKVVNFGKSKGYGMACSALWNRLRSDVPVTMDQLSDVHSLESLAGRLDEVLQQFRQPLHNLTDVRLSFARTLALARQGRVNVKALIFQLRTAISDLNNDAPPLKPHFASCFRQLYQQFAALHLDGSFSLKEGDITSLSLLAVLPTSETTWTTIHGDKSASAQLQTISAILPDPSEEHSLHDLPASVLRQLDTLASVSLSHLDLLQKETSVLGRTLASNLNHLSKTPISSLDTCLRLLLNEVVHAVEEDSSISENLREELSSSVRLCCDDNYTSGRDRNAANNASDPRSMAVKQLEIVAAYVNADSQRLTDRSEQAAIAWLSFGTACLSLYLSEVPFDPALKPRIERDIHRTTSRQYNRMLRALQIIAMQLTGDSGSLRSRLLESAITALGPEPMIDQVYRPEVSELATLQNDYSSLLRLVKSLQQTDLFTLLEDQTTWANLTLVRKSLHTQHKGYGDLTGPIVGFIDCLRMGRQLALRAQSARPQESKRSLAVITPLAEATNATWLSDQMFLEVGEQPLTQQERLHWLSAFAVRCSTKPITEASRELRQLVHDQCARFYEQWKHQLTHEQRKAAARSSLYRYRGDADAEDETDEEELDRIFPDFETAAPGTATHHDDVQHSAQGVVMMLAEIHGNIFAPLQSEPTHMLKLLNNISHCRQPSTPPSCLPMILQSVARTRDSLAQTATKAAYNIYVDGNKEQAKILVDTVRRIGNRFQQLHAAWPEHATPVDALRICGQILNVGHAEPLVKFLPLVEKLHSTTADWQKVASREYSVTNSLEEITTLIVSWRQLELSTWAAMIHYETQKCENEANSWWYVAFESIVLAAQSVNSAQEGINKFTEDLLATLEGFFTNSGLGEYGARLNLLRGFQAHLSVLIVDQPHLSVVRQGLASFVGYYGHFESAVEDALRTGRGAIEKQVRDVVQLASWKDRNVDVLRQSAKSSHKRLFRLIKKYRNLLAQPVLDILQGDLPGLPRSSGIIHPSPTPAVRLPSTPGSSQPSLSAWTERPERFVQIDRTTKRMTDFTDTILGAITEHEQLRTFTQELLADMAELRKATPAQLSEENKTLVGHLKTRKRRLFADVLKRVRQMGFKSSMSDETLAKQRSITIVMTRLPQIAMRAVRPDKQHAAEFALDQLMHTMPGVRQSARAHSEDLTAAEVSRSIANLESMLEVSIQQRQKLATHSQALCTLIALLEQCEAFAGSERATTAKPGVRWSCSQDIQSMQTLSLVLKATALLVDDSSRLSGQDYQNVQNGLNNASADLETLQASIALRRDLPLGIIDGDVSISMNRSSALLSQLQVSLQSWTERSPELGPILAQIQLWLPSDSGKTVTAPAPIPQSVDPNNWLQRLLDCGNEALRAVQTFHTPLLAPAQDQGTIWLIKQQDELDTAISTLRPDRLCSTLGYFLYQLPLLSTSPGNELPNLAMALAHMMPIFRTYAEISRALIDRLYDLHCATSHTAYQLSKVFVQLAKQGFCAPSDKPQTGEQQSGDVEAGTGLGDGEGGEDISKDVGAEEDLSELAQEGSKSEGQDDMEAHKDAVDMADEEMEGEVGNDEQEGEAGDDGNDLAKDGEDGQEMDEEPGEVDDLGNANVDEKMWDGEQKDDERSKKAEDSKGKVDEQDAGAANEGQAEGSGDENEDGGVGADDEGDDNVDEAERIGKEENDMADPHAEQQQNLDLPDDIEMDGNKAAEEESEFGSVADDNDLASTDEQAGQDDEPLVADAETKSEAEQQDGDGNDDEEMGIDRQEAESEVHSEEQDRDGDGLLQNKDETETADANNTEAATDEGNGPDKDMTQGMSSAPAPALDDEETKEAQEDAQATAGTNGGESKESGQDATGTQEDEVQHQTNKALKELGNALEDWYRQNRQISGPQTGEDEQSTEQLQNADMQNMQFEHVGENQATADAQALGAASADQSMPLDEEHAIDVNEDTTQDHQFTDDRKDTRDGADETMAPETMQIDPGDSSAKDQPHAFVGEQGTFDEDTDMVDASTDDNREDVDNVDEQLTNAHISDQADDGGLSLEQAVELWAQHEARTRNLALVLTEHLRLILNPTQATKMRGDFRTGKRLNIKRIIPYIASSFKRDKIWMRRSVPSKRSYQVMLAIDDSKSMSESESKDIAFETLALVSKSLSMLEVGELCVVGFGEDVTVAHDFATPFTTDAGAEVFRSFGFAQQRTNVRKLLAESIELFRAARFRASGAASELWQLQLIISDGVCEDHPSIRQLVRQAHEERIMVVFIVVDAANQRPSAPEATKQSILDLQTAEFSKDSGGEMQLKMVKYLDTFPFTYYLIVQDVQELPGVLAGALRQWFAEVVDTAG